MPGSSDFNAISDLHHVGKKELKFRRCRIADTNSQTTQNGLVLEKQVGLSFAVDIFTTAFCQCADSA